MWHTLVANHVMLTMEWRGSQFPCLLAVSLYACAYIVRYNFGGGRVDLFPGIKRSIGGFSSLRTTSATWYVHVCCLMVLSKYVSSSDNRQTFLIWSMLSQVTSFAQVLLARHGNTDHTRSFAACRITRRFLLVFYFAETSSR